ncbi:alpha/beta hydrolase [Yinghuangia aomiensis]|uniref:Alpha/beta hydrolase n=1 Tax=Yinghuangia aomiensis TaxID=676205 RepID=A0ABP9I425_9ACTN
MSYNYDDDLAGIIPLLPVPQPALPTSGLPEALAARENAAAFFASMPATAAFAQGVSAKDLHIRGHAGAPDVPVRIYEPQERSAGVLPAVLSIHGGGFSAGSIYQGESGASGIAARLGVVVVDVEYRLAPEHPAPAAVEDCYAALCWLHESSGALGIDPDRIALSGVSAGGGLAAGLALYARDHGGPPICFQFLSVPALDDRLDTPSMRRFVDTPLWNRHAAEQSWRWYLGGAQGPDVSIYAAPARAADLSGLPPAYVAVMEFDPLRDEGLMYAMRLLAAGVSTEVHCFPGAFHGSALVTGAEVSKRESRERFAVLRRALRVN